ncbi:hypothetical protein N7535_005166 [Penicillium sp. DV-2018c]|nr:hypothetical protein N7461_008745 [Penicillium sp. DV-2018c]KAJ5571506.1 hypothetical protein N7535_005166 [Penicillium sp. DV-2018c]
MSDRQEMSRYDHLKAVFARRNGQASENNDDSRSEITLVPRQPQMETRMKPKTLPDFNGKHPK